jgi:hypothetical protein
MAAQTKAWLAVPPPASRLPARPRIDEATAKDALAQANRLLDKGDIISARTIYQREAELGSATGRRWKRGHEPAFRRNEASSFVVFPWYRAMIEAERLFQTAPNALGRPSIGAVLQIDSDSCATLFHFCRRRSDERFAIMFCPNSSCASRRDAYLLDRFSPSATPSASHISEREPKGRN